jgi:hypothetical protein
MEWDLLNKSSAGSETRPPSGIPRAKDAPNLSKNAKGSQTSASNTTSEFSDMREPCPLSSATRFSRAFHLGDFTTFHAEALSSRYFLASATSLSAKAQVLSKMDRTAAKTAVDSHLADPQHDRVELNAPSIRINFNHMHLRPMFDPLWDPSITKRDALLSYVSDRGRSIGGSLPWLEDDISGK